MKTLYFDTGPLISLTMNNLLWILEPLKKKFGGRFIVTDHVKKELIDKPLKIKRFEFEALQLTKLINDGIIEVENPKFEHETDQMLDIANNTIKARGKYVKIVDKAEVEILVSAHKNGSQTAVIDERTIRLLLENPVSLADLMKKRLHTKTELDLENVKAFRKHLSGLTIIRSVELVALAYKMGLFESYVPPKMPDGRKVVLDALLWGVKLDGAAVTKKEIETLKKILE